MEDEAGALEEAKEGAAKVSVGLVVEEGLKVEEDQVVVAEGEASAAVMVRLGLEEKVEMAITVAVAVGEGMVLVASGSEGVVEQAVMGEEEGVMKEMAEAMVAAMAVVTVVSKMGWWEAV